MRRVVTLSGAGVSMLCAIIGAAGWIFENHGLKTAFVGESTMKPNTALALLLVGAALVSLAYERRRAAVGLSSAVIAIAIASLGSRVGVTALDKLWWASDHPQQLSLGTVTSLVCLGIALAFATLERPALWTQLLASVSTFISFVGFAGYTLGLSSMAASAFWNTMALHTAAGLFAASGATLFLLRTGPLTRMLVGGGIAATLGRRMSAFVTAVPWIAAILLVNFGGDAAQAAALSISQVLVPAILALLAGVLRFTSTVAHGELDLSITLDSIGDGVLLTDNKGRLVRLNPVAERLTGFTTHEAKGKPVEEIFHIINQDSRQVVESPVARVLREGVVVGLANHTNLIDRGGVERPIADSGAPIRADDGTIRGVVLVFRDVSEQYAVQRALTRSATMLRSVMHAMPIGLVATRDGTIVWTNPAASRLLGAGAELTRPLVEFLPPEELVTRSDGGPRRTRLFGKSGEVLVDMVPVPEAVDVDGLTAQLTVLARVDDSEALQTRLARRAALQQATAELSRRVAEATFDLQHILNETARLAVTAHSDFCIVMLFEQTPEGPRVRARASFAHTDKLLAFTQRFNIPMPVGATSQRTMSGDTIVLPPAALRAAVGDNHHLIEGTQTALLQPLRAEGVTLGMLAIGRSVDRPFDDDEKAFWKDLADRSAQALRNAQLFETTTSTLATLKATEEQLRHSQKLEAVGQLAGGVAHDFNNLLSVILTLVELLLNGRAADDPERPDLEDIRSAATRAAGLTKQLLAFSRKQVMQLRPLDVNEVVRGAERLLRPLLGEDIRLTLDLGLELGLVRADANLLTQVLMNLGVNARDAMPKGGLLTVSTAKPSGPVPSELSDSETPFICITVSDQGTGMPSSVLEHLFEPFFTTKGPGRGTGLGLSTSYGIVRQTGGTVTVSSIENQGTTFTVWLPLYQGGPRAVTPPPVLDGRPRTGNLLLVEDEPAVRDVACRLLRMAGYTVTVAGGVREGLAAADAMKDIDLVLTDVVMPDGNGRELADALLERRLGLKVVFMSGYTDDAVMQRGVATGTVRLLQKPFTQETLLSAVAAALA